MLTSDEQKSAQYDPASSGQWPHTYLQNSGLLKCFDSSGLNSNSEDYIKKKIIIIKYKSIYSVIEWMPLTIIYFVRAITVR